MKHEEAKQVIETTTQMMRFAYNHGVQDERGKIIRFLEMDLLLADLQDPEAQKIRILDLLKSRDTRHAEGHYPQRVKTQE